jgi:hypothetical protein
MLLPTSIEYAVLGSRRTPYRCALNWMALPVSEAQAPLTSLKAPGVPLYTATVPRIAPSTSATGDKASDRYAGLPPVVKPYQSVLPAPPHGGAGSVGSCVAV